MWTHSFQAFAVVGLAFLLAHLMAEALMRRALVHAGVLFVALGVAAGPLGVDLIAHSGLDLAPLAQLIVGWVGLQAGLGLSVRADGGLVPGALRAGIVYSVIGLMALGGLAWLVTWGLLELPTTDALLAAAVLAAACVAGAPHAVRAIAVRYGTSGPVGEAGESLARVSRVIAIAAFALAIVFTTRPAVADVGELAPTGWLLGEIGLGLVLGLLSDFLLGDDPDDRRLVLALMGSSAFATGVALHLGQSPLLPNLVIGLVLVNFGGRSAPRHRAVTGLEQSTLYLLLVYAGAAWVPHFDPRVYGAAAALVALRLVVGGYAGAIAAQTLDPTNAALRRVGMTFVGQGAPAAALAVAYTLLPGAAAAELALTVVLASIVLNDLWAARSARMVLDEAGEIPLWTTTEP